MHVFEVELQIWFSKMDKKNVQNRKAKKGFEIRSQIK